MAAIRSSDTKPELMLRKALWAAGLRGYRLHRRDLPGRPDVCFGPDRIAVFVDGAFWHGHASAYTKGKSGEYWDAKIARNVARDRAADAALCASGWTVARFWDFEVRRELAACVDAVSRLRAFGPDQREVPSGAAGTMIVPDVQRDLDPAPGHPA